jgi:hypothetical protein
MLTNVYLVGEAATEGRKIVIAMLLVGTVFLAVVAIGELSLPLRRRLHARRRYRSAPRPVGGGHGVTGGADQSDDVSPHERIQHEVDNINTRLTWLLTFQGFLFATISLASNEVRQALSDIIPWVGVGAALLAFLGILAAYLTIDDIRSEHPAGSYGARIRSRKYLGRINSLGIPAMLIGAWIVLYFKMN